MTQPHRTQPHRWSIVVALLATVPLSQAQADNNPAPIAVISWKTLAEQDQLTTGEFVAADGTEPDRLRISRTEASPRLFTLHEFVPPPISQPTYVVRGRVRSLEVWGSGYLEMWNHFPGGKAYFTRTLDRSGPLGRITGTSDWRDFALPFNQGQFQGPEKLVLNLQLDGPGTVEVTNLALFAPASANAWWGDRMGGLIGGLGGSFLGVFLGGCLGPLMAMGKARRFVMTSYLTIGVLCAAVLVTGIVAVAMQQPYAVYYPLLLLGGLGTSFCILGLRAAGRKYHEAELRRMTALDAAG